MVWRDEFFEDGECVNRGLGMEAPEDESRVLDAGLLERYRQLSGIELEEFDVALSEALERISDEVTDYLFTRDSDGAPQPRPEVDDSGFVGVEFPETIVLVNLPDYAADDFTTMILDQLDAIELRWRWDVAETAQVAFWDEARYPIWHRIRRSVRGLSRRIEWSVRAVGWRFRRRKAEPLDG